MHVMWWEDHKGDEVRCRLVATQLAIGERLDVMQSTPPLMVARLFLAIVSLRVAENEGNDWVFGFWDVSVAFYHTTIQELVYVHPQRGTCPLGLLLEAHQSYEWYSKNSFQGMACAGKRHTGHRWCDESGSSADGVRAQRPRRLQCSRFSASHGLAEPHHGEPPAHGTAGKNWTKL